MTIIFQCLFELHICCKFCKYLRGGLKTELTTINENRHNNNLNTCVRITSRLYLFVSYILSTILAFNCIGFVL